MATPLCVKIRTICTLVRFLLLLGIRTEQRIHVANACSSKTDGNSIDY